MCVHATHNLDMRRSVFDYRHNCLLSATISQGNVRTAQYFIRLFAYLQIEE
jgi:hypothetical protein